MFRNTKIKKYFSKLAIIVIVFLTIFSNLRVDSLVAYRREKNIVDKTYWESKTGKITEALKPKEAKAATPQFSPTGGSMVTGTAVANAGTNVASYRGTFSSDNVFWSILGTTTGFDLQVDLGNVALNGANKLLLTTETANVTTSRAFYIQICDWVSSSGVNNAADAQCTGGGWRTLNNPRATAYTETSDTSRTFEIFDGYFYSGTTPGTKVSTSLSNFVSGSSVKVRFYSTVNSTVQFNVDRVQLEAAVDPVYYPNSYNAISPFSGTTSNFYTDTFGSNNTRFTITNSASNAMDFYYSFQNIETYTGANSILVVFEGAYVSAVSLTYNFAIYNFSTSSWEGLNSSSITAGSTSADQAHYFSKSNITLSNYISSGEARIRVYSAELGTQTFGIDMIYITIGSVNDDISKSEVSFGQATSTDASATRDLEATSSSIGSNAWTQTTCLNNTLPCATTPYASDWAGTWGTNYSAAANVSIPITVPTNASITGIRYAARFRSNHGGNTVQLGLRDYSGQYAGQTVAGGWTGMGSTNANTTFTFTDGIYQVNPEDFIDTVNNLGNLRLRTSSSTAVSSATRDWDFAFMSIRWIEDPAARPTILSQFIPTSGSLVTGTALLNTSANVGSYKGAIASDNVYWSNTTTASGIDAQVDLENVTLNGANKMFLYTEEQISPPGTFYIQICDWVSSSGVNNAADARCTGGGWRTLNNPRTTAYSNTTDTARTFEIFDGYFYTDVTPGTKVSTPLSNFISGDTVRIRYYSSSSTITTLLIDRVQLETGIDPVYYPDSYNPISPFGGEGITSNYYADTFGSNNTRFTINNNLFDEMDGYFSFKNIQTYTGANTILTVFEGGYVSATSLTYNLAIYNFSTSSWEDLNASQITASATGTDQSNYFAKSNVTLSNYISSGEVRIRVYTTVLGVQTFGIDMLYITVGSVNNDTGNSEVSFGQATATDSSATADLAATSSSVAGNTWTQTTCLNNTSPCSTTPYVSDWSGTWGTNYSAAANVSVPITVPSNASVTGIRYATRHRSNLSTNSVQLGIRDYSGQYVGQTIAGGWNGVATATATTTFNFFDGIYQVNPEDLIDTTNNLGNLRLRTSASTATSSVTRDWDFAFMSIRWVTPIGVLSISSTGGTQVTSLNSGDTGKYAHDTSCASTSACSAFTLSISAGSQTITSVKITEIGTVDAANNLTNLALYYDSDGNYSNGVTGQYGSTVTDITSEAATFAGSISLSAGSTFYFYLGFDLAKGGTYPKGGQTIDFSINANSDIGTSASPYKTGAPVSLGGSITVKPNATSTTYGSGLTDGGRSGESITISGYGFGAPSSGANQETCGGAVDTGCVRFTVGGAATVDDTNITSWSNTQIVFSISTSINTTGGASALEVVSGSQAISTPFTFYIYPNITGMTTCSAAGNKDNACGTNAAPEYSASDTWGLIQLNGDHLASTAGTIQFTGGFGTVSGTVHGTAEGACTVAGWSATSVCVQVSSSIANNVYDGTITLTRTGDSLTDTTDLHILPRITSNTPTTGQVGEAITIEGDHFCQTGTCPTAPPTTDHKVLFGSTETITSDFVATGDCAAQAASWSDTRICAKVPTGTPILTQNTKVIGKASPLYESERESFSVLSSTPIDPTSLSQYKSDGSTAITTGGTTAESSVTLKANITSSMSINMALQVEVKPIGTSFECTSGECSAATEGTVLGGGACASCTSLSNASVTVSSLTDNTYHWQARTRNTTSNEYSSWVAYGSNLETETDFRTDTVAPTVTLSGGSCETAVSSVGTNGATITWTLNESADGQVEYSTSSDLSSSLFYPSTAEAAALSHAITVPNFSSSTTYYFRVKSKDSVNNTTTNPSSAPYCSLTTSSVGVLPVKTTSFFVTGETSSIAATTTDNTTFSVPVPETSSEVKSAFVEITGISASGGTNNIQVQVNGQTAKTYAINASSNTHFKIIYQITTLNLSTDSSPTTNTLLITPSLDTYIASAKVVASYSYSP